jgi:HK97 family phage major capsid protein
MAEAGTITATKPKFRQVELKLKKVAAACYATDEQLADTTALASWLERTVPQELRFKVEDAFVNGDGLGKPSGIMQSACLVSQLRLDANKIQMIDLFNMLSRRWAGVNDYVWLCSTDILPQIWSLNNTYQNLYVPRMQEKPYGSLLGLPMIETEYNPKWAQPATSSWPHSASTRPSARAACRLRHPSTFSS